MHHFFRGAGARRRGFLVAGVAALVLAAVALLGTWYLAGRIDAGALEPRHSAPDLPLRVLQVSADTLTLKFPDPDDDALKPGVWGLMWQGGYAQVTDIVSSDSAKHEVVRKFTPVRGVPAVGTFARLDNSSFPGTPESRGLAFEDVTYPAPGGPTPAWLVRGSKPTWAIFVHGKGADRREALRMLPAVTGLGYPALVIAYRNDPEAPGGDNGRYRYGASERADLEAAVQYALQSGAQDVVLVGYSMGGGIVASFLQHSAMASRARGAILDAPMLDFATTVDHGLEDGGVPGFITFAPRWLAARRYDIDWDALDYADHFEAVHMPVLLFHGTGDDLVPESISERLVARRPDLVTFVRVPGVGHVRAWNVDPPAYERAVRDFLGKVGP